MNKIQLTGKQVTRIAYMVALLGLFSEYLTTGRLEVVNIIKSIAGSVSFWFDIGRDRSVQNYFNLLFYALMLLGAYLFTQSSYRETRLTRFVFAVTFYNRALFILIFIIHANQGLNMIVILRNKPLFRMG